MIYTDGVQPEQWVPTASEATPTRKASEPWDPTTRKGSEPWDPATRKGVEPWVPALPEAVIRKTPQTTPHHQRDDPSRISIKSSSSGHGLRYSPELEFNSEQCSSVASSE